RWNHPKRGLIPPLEFIPIAEASNLILTLGEWVLRKACKDLVELSKIVNKEFRLAVNVSTHQFNRQDMFLLVEKILKETGFSANFLDLELTESIFMETSEKTSTIFKKLSAIGVNLVIDDFGTGYSNLSYLKNLKISKIKIDRSFIQDLSKDSLDMTLVISMITMAHALGLKVVGEGAETKDQVGLLCAGKCNELQGYYFSHPQPIEYWKEHVPLFIK
ncbi:MAG: sensor diguanylate cyclase/phosphodiesterase, partial [Francisellaceae bacterium]|nr:sensor diguanylate cyclase/phosphodiesterase [Francisellaceae bacterium]